MASKQEPNLDLFIETLARIFSAPRWSPKAVRAWRQAAWAFSKNKPGKNTNVCGTAFCFAGHALDIKGYKFKWEKMGDGYNADFVTTQHGKTSRFISDVAEDELGIPGDPLNLFGASNSRKILLEKSAKYLNVSPEVLKDKVYDRIADGGIQDRTL